MFRKMITLLLSTVIIIATVAGSTTAQSTTQTGCPDYSERSRYGTAQLEAGFLPDPHSVAATSGGNTNVRDCSNVPSSCVGNVMSNPDYRLQLSGNSAGIRVFFIGEGDATLIINDPAGRWYCNDDSYATLHPTVNFGDPLNGQYDIWIGSYTSSFDDGRLYITELNSVNVGTVIDGEIATPTGQSDIIFPITATNYVATGWARYTIGDTGVIQATLNISHSGCTGSSRLLSMMALYDESGNPLWGSPWQSLTVGGGSEGWPPRCGRGKEETFIIQGNLPSAEVLARAYEMRVFATRNTDYLGIPTEEVWQIIGEMAEEAARTYVRSQTSQ